LDIFRVQDVGLAEEPDSVILDWAVRHGRIIITHDVSTMTAQADDRIRAGLQMAGVCVVPQSLARGRAIADLAVTVQCTFESDWENQVRYIPL
jgi:hypothetical protein